MKINAKKLQQSDIQSLKKKHPVKSERCNNEKDSLIYIFFKKKFRRKQRPKFRDPKEGGGRQVLEAAKG